MFPCFCAHFGRFWNVFLPFLCRSVHVSRLSCTLWPLSECIPSFSLPKYACISSFVHTLAVFCLCFSLFLCRSVHVSLLLCTLWPLLECIPSFSLPKYACISSFVHTLAVFRLCFSLFLCRSMHVSLLLCTLWPLLECVPSFSFAEVCMFLVFRAHFGSVSPLLQPLSLPKCACFLASVHTLAAFGMYSFLFFAEVCMYLVFRAHFGRETVLLYD